MNENELKHYGVPGMRWGHRKASLTGGPNKPPREAKVEYQKPKKPKYAVSSSRISKDSTISEVAKSERAARGKKVAKSVLTALGIAAGAAAAGVVATAAVGAYYMAGAVLTFTGNGDHLPINYRKYGYRK